ncbi:hypothetical protein PSCICM_48540 [Pseudomonas cichorii]|nr:hypothetical protein PSCICM_48540 [Pseudomonas cichorii]
MRVATYLLQSDISVPARADQQYVPKAKLTERPHAVQTIGPSVGLQLPEIFIKNLLWVILFVQDIAQLGIVPDLDQIACGIDPQIQNCRK